VEGQRRTSIRAKKPKIKEEDLARRYQDLLEVARLMMGPRSQREFGSYFCFKS
jgi:hypothetical protein